MESSSNQLNQVLEQGVRKLLARAVDARALKTHLLLPRITAAVEKYLLRDDPNTSPADISAFIEGIQADDLCLIIACERNDEGAWSDLVERFTPIVRSAARSATANEDAAEDLAQSIWAELYGLRGGKDGQRSSKLAYYSGRGSLAGWLRAVVAQLAVDTYRKQSRFVQTEEDADLDRLARNMPSLSESHAATASSLLNPEQVIANRLAGSDMQEALNRAVKELDAEDRLLVKLYYFDGLRLREAGVVLGVHEATASRRLMRIHGDLKKRVRHILMEEFSWTESETERSFTEIGQHLDADLEALVTKEEVS